MDARVVPFFMGRRRMVGWARLFGPLGLGGLFGLSGAAACSRSTTSVDGPQPSAEATASTSEANELVCPTIAITPHAELKLPTALAEAGTYELKVTADDQTEECEVTLASVGGAQVSGAVVTSPTTRVVMTCKLLRAGGIQNDGSVLSLSTVGTPRRVELSVSRGGKSIVKGAAEPSYEPDRCGFVKPTVMLR